MKNRVFGLFVVLMILTLGISPSTVLASQEQQGAEHWCGMGIESEKFGFPFDNGNVPHWTVNGESFVSADTINQVDVILDALDGDNIANTMILFLDSKDVAVGPSCVGQFLDYMGLGNVDGPRADNGFAWLFVYNSGTNSLEVFYAVGGSLNSLLANDLKPMKRFGSDTYDATQSLDAALLETIKAFDTYSRTKYEPYHPAQNPTMDTQPQPTSSIPSWVVNCLLCLLVLFVLAVFYFAIRYGSPSTGTTRTYSPTPSRSHPSPRVQSRPTSSPKSRGGRGSGKSTRVG